MAMSEGSHKISAADASGNSAHVLISVGSGSVKESEEELPVLEEAECASGAAHFYCLSLGIGTALFPFKLLKHAP